MEFLDNFVALATDNGQKSGKNDAKGSQNSLDSNISGNGNV